LHIFAAGVGLAASTNELLRDSTIDRPAIVYFWFHNEPSLSHAEGNRTRLCGDQFHSFSVACHELHTRPKGRARMTAGRQEPNTKKGVCFPHSYFSSCLLVGPCCQRVAYLPEAT